MPGVADGPAPDSLQPATFLRSIPIAAAADLRNRGKERRFATGQALFREGDPPSSVAVILDGTVKVSARTANGPDTLLAMRGPGSVIGEFAAIDRTVRSATVTAVRPVRALLVPCPAFEAFLAEQPAAALALLRLVVARLRDSDRLRVEFGTLEVQARLARRLLELARDHGEDEGDAIQIRLSVTQDDLAGMVGASRQSVARSLRELREAGLIETGRRSLTIVDAAGLTHRA
jgi:CRP/FNR family cyclic AMP-dependent transcriptional regulator